MRREDLMKPDLLSQVLVLGSAIVMVAALLLVMVLALTHAGTGALYATPPSSNYSSLRIDARWPQCYKVNESQRLTVPHEMFNVAVHNA
jgi:hypothetical protein